MPKGINTRIIGTDPETGKPINKNNTNESWTSKGTIIGVQSGAYVVVSGYDSSDATIEKTDVTHTTGFFSAGDWITLKSNAARLLLTNSAGEAITLSEVSIRGKPVQMLYGDEGFIHDSFVDYEGIDKNGESVFEFGNEDIVTKAQLEALADYWWKYHKIAKHIYVCTMSGMRHYLQPGEWYNLQIGGAGLTEYIDSVVECFNVRMMRGAGEIGETTVMFREVEEAWKHDSSAAARFIASGSAEGLLNNKLVVTVGSSTFAGQANIYCDGTADEVQINSIIAQMSASGIHGTVHLTAGTFVLGAAIKMKSNITLEGEGAGATIVEKNCNDYGIHGDGGDGTEIENACVRALTVTRNASDTNDKNLVYFTYCDNLQVSDVLLSDSDAAGIIAAYCDGITLSNITVNGFAATGTQDAYGIDVEDSTDMRISNLVIKTSTTGGYGFSIFSPNVTSNASVSDVYVADISGEGACGVRLDDCVARMANVEVLNITSSTSDMAYGIVLGTANCQLSNIHVDDVDNTDTAANAYGIYVTKDDNSLGQVLVQGGTGTGVYFETTADDNVVTGRSENNGTNLDDNGSGNNTSLLIAT